MDKSNTNEEASPRLPRELAQWYDVPFAPVPNWLLRELPSIPPADRSVMAVLFEQLYSGLPFGGLLCINEIAKRAKLNPTAAMAALRRRMRAGWVEEGALGQFGLVRSVVTRAPQRPAGPIRRPVPTQYSLADVVPVPHELLDTWTAYLDDDELVIVLNLVNRSWRAGHIDGTASLTELMRGTGEASARRAPRQLSVDRARRALTRLILMEVLWCIEAPEGAGVDTPGVFRLNREWDRLAREP